MPLVFCELALAYPPEKVSNPESTLAAANGQFILVKREAYFAAGGHAAVAESVLEDVALARRIKRRKAGLRFRYAPDALSTRMYRSFGQMYEGWTKNLALLFGNSLALAAWRVYRSAVAGRLAGDLLRVLPARAALVGADGAVGADAVALLPAGGAIELSLPWIALWRSSDCRCFVGCWCEAGFITR